MEEYKMTKTLLIVEDDPAIREFLVLFLEEVTPYQVVVAEDAIEALTVAEAVKPLLCVLDYNLPFMNGLQLYDRIRTLPGLQETGVLLMSANLPEQELAQRHIPHISKPFELNDLLQALERLMK